MPINQGTSRAPILWLHHPVSSALCSLLLFALLDSPKETAVVTMENCVNTSHFMHWRLHTTHLGKDPFITAAQPVSSAAIVLSWLPALICCFCRLDRLPPKPMLELAVCGRRTPKLVLEDYVCLLPDTSCPFFLPPHIAVSLCMQFCAASIALILWPDKAMTWSKDHHSPLSRCDTSSCLGTLA